MPKLTKSLPKYRKHKASGQAIVTLNGDDHYLGPHGTAVNRRKYDRLMAEYLDRDRQPVPLPADETTINEVLAAFWKHTEKWCIKNGKLTDELTLYRIMMRDVKAL